MTKAERLKKAQIYLDKQKDRLVAPVPKKHVSHPESFREYLRNEIKAAEAAVDGLLLNDAATFVQEKKK